LTKVSGLVRASIPRALSSRKPRDMATSGSEQAVEAPPARDGQ
jgi:hypothetical protein